MITPGQVDAVCAQLRSSRETARSARELLAWTRARLDSRRRTRGDAGRLRGDGVRHRLTCGNEPLGRVGLVTLARCGHWWVYPIRAGVEQMHDLARFSLGLACSFCLAACHDALNARACGTATRVN